VTDNTALWAALLRSLAQHGYVLDRHLAFERRGGSGAHRLPAIYEADFFVRDGGLMSYGPEFDASLDRVAALVDRLLRGAKLTDLPFEQPTRFRLAINLKTARTLGLEVPPMLLTYTRGQIRISGQHEEVLIVRHGGVIERIATIGLGFPLGLQADIAAFVRHISAALQLGEGVVLYTDGITEARICTAGCTASTASARSSASTGPRRRRTCRRR